MMHTEVMKNKKNLGIEDMKKQKNNIQNQMKKNQKD